MGSATCSLYAAGNVANEDEIAFDQYATEHLHVPLILVLGHTQCGAVTAIVDGDDLPPEIHHLTVHIEEALAITRRNWPELRGPELIEATVIANVRESVKDMLQGGPLLKSAVAEGYVRVEGAVYDLHTGRVTWLDPSH
jgi:carbonic anhydrase